MATAAVSVNKKSKDILFEWEGKDKTGKIHKGELRASGEAAVSTSLRRQGIMVTTVKRRKVSGGKAVKPKDISIFTRQLSTMMKAGVPLVQSFDIVGKGSTNPRLTKLLNDIRSDLETGSSLSVAFRKYPLYFNALYCNLVEAGEAGGILEAILDRLALSQEKTLAMKAKIKSALLYPIAVIVVAFIVLAVIMIFVIPAFKSVFESFGANLPAPTLLVMGMSDIFVKWWYAIFGFIGGGIYFFLQSWKRSKRVQEIMDRLLLKLPIFGPLVYKSALARWTRTLATLFSAGVPLVEALDSVGGASGNVVFLDATKRIQKSVSSGISLTTSMESTGIFPVMVLQMCSIGEESGSLDHMLSKVAEFFEEEVDEAVKGISSLMEPFIIVFLGTLIGGIVVSMYLPIFKLGQVV